MLKYKIMETNKRTAGILLHITSLPGTPGIGTMGAKAYDFVNWLEKAGQHLWQVLPIGPTGYGDSPYASFSTFAGNPLLIDLDDLVARNWATAEMIKPADYIKNEGPVDYGSVVWWKIPVLKNCAVYFMENASKEDRRKYEAFKNDESAWLNNFAIFMSIKEFYDAKANAEGVSGTASVWNAFWPKELAKCDPKATSRWAAEHVKEVEIYKVIQFFFQTQWLKLKEYANSKNVKIVGDIPIFVALDSADVWSHQELFQMDKKTGLQLKAAGVPPDYFSATGQLWGNPLYDWAAMEKTKYYWWVERIKRLMDLVDFVRIDHFRGFDEYWSIPYGEETAINGQWMPGPKKKLFDAIKKSLGDLPIIAEDLGDITESVIELRDGCKFPGMKILQFAFDANEAGAEGFTNAFLPHMYPKNCVVYTGTHDNETLQGWINESPDKQLMNCASYLLGRPVDAGEAKSMANNGQLCALMVKAAYASTADMCIIPLQDVFGFGHDTRMNTPSTTGANWAWRMDENLLNDTDKANWLKQLNYYYGRV